MQPPHPFHVFFIHTHPLRQKLDVNKSISCLYKKGTFNAINISFVKKVTFACLAKKEMSTTASYKKGTFNAINILFVKKVTFVCLSKKEMSTKVFLIYTKKAPSMQSIFYS
jgi:hypothetical protein